MRYQTPALTLVGSATGLVLGTTLQHAGPMSDNKTDVALGIVLGNSRYTQLG